MQLLVLFNQFHVTVGVATLTVGGAAYGAKNYNNMKTTKNHALKLGLISSIIIVIIFFTFAEPLSHIFAYSTNNPYLVQRIAEVIRIQSFFILVMPMGWWLETYSKVWEKEQ